MIFITVRETQKKPLIWQRIGAAALALLVWQGAAMALHQDLLLASPLQVCARLISLLGMPGTWHTLLFSAVRIISGFLLGFAVGTALAILAGKMQWLEILLWPFVVSIKSIPVASFIIISLIFFTSRQLSVFISFLMVFPVIYSNVLHGVKNTDGGMLEMARVFRLSWGKRLRYVHLPALKPFLLSASSVALGLSWKAGIAAEVIGIPDGSIGEMLYQAKIYFDTADLFAWTVIIVLVSQFFEKFFLFLLRKSYKRLENA